MSGRNGHRGGQMISEVKDNLIPVFDRMSAFYLLRSVTEHLFLYLSANIR
jgi:hypothetical protein